MNTSYSPALCEFAASFREDNLIVSVVFLMTIVSTLNLLFLYLVVFQSRELRRIWSLIGLDLKIITFVGISFYFISAVNAFTLSFYKSVTFLVKMPDCAYVWKGTTCFLTQSLYTGMLVIGHGMFHNSLFIERCYATFKGARKRYDGVLGVVLILLTFILCPLPQLSFMGESDFINPRPYCAFILEKADPKGLSSAYLAISTDWLVTLADIWLYFVNKKKVKGHKQKPHGFNLHRSFILRELEITINIVYPFSVVHSLTYFAQIFLYAAFVKEAVNWPIEKVMLLYECSNLLRVLSNLILFVFAYFYGIRMERTKRRVKVEATNNFDRHFREFQRIIK